MHSTLTEISSSEDETTYIMYGGRVSPKQYVNACPIVVNVSRSYLVTLECNMDTCGAQPRYRHSAVALKQRGVAIVFIFGGRAHSQQGILVFNDLWKVILPEDEDKAEMCNIEDCSMWPCERFSHSAESVDVDSEYSDMYISGGLDKFFTPLSDLWKFSSRTEKWSRIAVEGMLPRYGHTSHVLGNKLIMVGGVNTYDELQPGVGVIDLTTNVCVEFKLPDLSPEKPIVLINHTSTLYRDKGIIRTFGGGGNFFSFGTFFNNFSVEIPLHQF
uniref:Uncharacterized protein n=2 Tax=Clastoptera arizonana TaxID=38151 RepID=A0A1B6CAF6_9HEMI